MDWGGGSTDGLNFVNGNVQSLNMSVTSDFTVGNVQFSTDGLTFDYTPATATYALTGGAQISFIDGGATDVIGVQLRSPGLVITSGDLKSLHAAVTGALLSRQLQFTADA